MLIYPVLICKRNFRVAFFTSEKRPVEPAMSVLRNQLYDGIQNILDQRFQSRRENFKHLSVCVY